MSTVFGILGKALLEKSPMPTRQSKIVPGSRWLEVVTGRVIVIIESEVHGTGPSWRYEDGGDYGETNWHYCDMLDFLVWGRFKLLERK